uniref:hypothetical protein n=1 Tax=Demequina gelatinilytica TaxID=1638980 RepID=UPI001E538482
MAEVRRPPRPAVRRDARSSSTAPSRPQPPTTQSTPRPRAAAVRAEAESEEVAQPWRRDASRTRAA